MANLGGELPWADSDPRAQLFRDNFEADINHNQALADLSDGLLVVEDTEAVNHKLGELDRSDLAIVEQPELTPVTEIKGITDKYPTFVSGFHLKGKHRAGNDWRKQPLFQPEPVNQEDLAALRSMPKLKTEEDVKAIRRTSLFQGIYLASHAIKPAFIRMNLILPGFTARTVLEFTRAVAPADYSRLEAQTFAAYQVISQLVDRDDLFVILSDGLPDADYLLGRN